MVLIIGTELDAMYYADVVYDIYERMKSQRLPEINDYNITVSRYVDWIAGINKDYYRKNLKTKVE